MEHFLASCDQAENFPKNLIHHDTYQHNLKAYVERLDKKQSYLFSDEEQGSLDLMEYDVQTRSTSSCSLLQLCSDENRKQFAAEIKKSTLPAGSKFSPICHL
jgi:hypothetical protein